MSVNKTTLKNKENILAEDLFLHLIYHASAKQGFDVGVQIFADLIAILKSEKIDFNKLKKGPANINCNQS